MSPAVAQSASFYDVYAVPEPGWGCLGQSPTGQYTFTYDVSFTTSGFSPGQGVRVLAFLSRPGHGDEGLKEICDLSNPADGNHTCSGSVTLGGTYLQGYDGQVDLYYKTQFYWSGAPTILDEADHTIYEICGQDPALSRSPTFVNLGTTGTIGTFEVWNSGGGALTYTITDNKTWIQASPTSGSSSGEHDTITVSVNRSGLPPDTYSGIVTITPSTGSPQYVDVFMEVSGTPATDDFAVHYVSPLEGSTIYTSEMVGAACCYEFDIDIDYDVTGDGSFCFNFAPQGQSCTGCDSGPGYDVTAGSGLLSLSDQLWCCHVQQLCGYTGPAVLSIWFQNDDTGIMSGPIQVSYTIASPANDTDPPQPNPSSWELPPTALSNTEIAMGATHTEDPSGVEFYFECTSGGGHDSGWQDSDNYTDTGLSPNTQFCYRVKARDKSPNRNEAGWSQISCATTQAQTVDTFPPTPNPPTWNLLPTAISPSAVSMSVFPCSDPSGVEYFFEETTGNPGGSSSGWQSSAAYTDTGLSQGVQYGYRVRARDASPSQNTSQWTVTLFETTQSTTCVADLAVTNLQFHTYDQTNQVTLSSADQMTVSARVYNNSDTVTAQGVVLQFSDDSGQWLQVTSAQDVPPQGCAYFQVVRSFESGFSGDITAAIVSSTCVDPWRPNNSMTKPMSIWFVSGTQSRDAFSLTHDAYSFENWPNFTVPLVEFDVGGHCFGMSLMALRYWRGDESLPDGATTTYELSDGSAAATGAIESAHWEQTGLSVSYALDLCSGLFSQSSEFDSFVQEMKAGKPAIANLKPDTAIGGHAVLAYRLVEVEDETRIYIYDNNAPHNSSYSLIAGAYYLSFEPKGTAFNGVRLATFMGGHCEVEFADQYQDLVNVRCSTLPFPDVDIMAGLTSLGLCMARTKPLTGPLYYQFVGSPAHALFIDSQGRRFGIHGDTFYDEIPGARISLVDSFDVYVLPLDANYETIVSCFGEGQVHLVSLSNETQGGVVTWFDEAAVGNGTLISFDVKRGVPNAPARVDLGGDGGVDSLLDPHSLVVGSEAAILGDVNSDSNIDLHDVRLCLQIAVGAVTGTALQREAADVNGDGDVDESDVRILAEYVLRIRETLP